MFPPRGQGVRLANFLEREAGGLDKVSRMGWGGGGEGGRVKISSTYS